MLHSIANGLANHTRDSSGLLMYMVILLMLVVWSHPTRA